MPEHLRALIVVLGLAAMAFWFSGTFARECGVASSQFNERRRLWFLVTLTAFLAHSFWLFLFVAASLIVFLAPRGDNKIATFYFLLFAVPVLRADVGGGVGLRPRHGPDRGHAGTGGVGP